MWEPGEGFRLNCPWRADGLSSAAMTRVFSFLFASFLFWPIAGFGWGEAGHHLVSRLAAKLAAKHPELKDVKEGDARKALDQFLKLLKDRRYQQGMVSVVPDVHWRNLDDGLAALGNQLGAPTHFLDGEFLVAEGVKDPFEATKIPLEYDAARAAFAQVHPTVSFFKTIGTAPWRAQQFASLTRAAFEAAPKAACETLETRDDHPTRTALTFAGLLSHFTADAAMPLHGTRDSDSVSTGQKGLHWYFENDLVDALEPSLEAKVEAQAEKVFLGPANQKASLAALLKRVSDRHPDLKRDDRITAVVMRELADSYANIKRLQDLDLKYAVATAEEALNLEACHPTVSALIGEMEKTTSKAKRRELMRQKAIGSKEPEQPPCRRLPTALADWAGAPCKVPGAGCRTVAAWHETLIVERLALATAITADAWVRAWRDAGSPYLCSTWKYALKPSFVSPTNGACFGYAKNEKPEDLTGTARPNPTIWKSSAKSVLDCIQF
jgi:hypothetical protein